MVEIVGEAVEIRNQRMEEALHTIEEGFPEIAASLRTLVESADLMGSTRAVPSLDTAELLFEAGAELHKASAGLQNLPDLVDQIKGLFIVERGGLTVTRSLA